jgi:mannose-6-phosphate isomerase-like protein (cupin superfamily)
MLVGPLILSLLVPVLFAACAMPFSGHSANNGQPPPAQFLFNENFSSDAGTLKVTVDRELYPPHYAGLWHTHPGPGSFCVLQGKITIEVRGRSDIVLTADQCWMETPGIVHRPTNQTDQEAVALFYLMAPANQPRIIPVPPSSGT